MWGRFEESKSAWWIRAALLLVVLSEVFIGLDLTPFVILLPRPVLLSTLVAMAIAAAVALLLSQLSRGGLRFSLKTLLLLVLLVSWPAARLTNEMRREARLVNAQRSCFSMLKELPAKQVTFGGRYNDGCNDLAIQRWLFYIVAMFVDPNELPHEIAYLKDVDLSDTTAADPHLTMLAAAGTIEVLDLSRTAVTTSGLEQLVRLKSLRELRLYGVAVSDETLEKLQAALIDATILR